MASCLTLSGCGYNKLQALDEDTTPTPMNICEHTLHIIADRDINQKVTKDT